MSAFRFLLCLAGLVIYLVIKQFTVAHPDGKVLPRPVGRSVGPKSPDVPEGWRARKPQTIPHTEILKPDRGSV